MLSKLGDEKGFTGYRKKNCLADLYGWDGLLMEAGENYLGNRPLCTHTVCQNN